MLIYIVSLIWQLILYYLPVEIRYRFELLCCCCWFADMHYSHSIIIVSNQGWQRMGAVAPVKKDYEGA